MLFTGAICCMAQQTEIRIDISGIQEKIAIAPVKSEQGLNVVNPLWMDKNKDCYLSVTGDNADKQWASYEFSFIPDKNGKVRIMLMGPWFKARDAKNNFPIWVAYDNFAVIGADIKNPDFENINAEGLLDGWECKLENIVQEKDSAPSGRNYVKVWHNLRAVQVINVEKNRKVTVKFSAKMVDSAE